MGRDSNIFQTHYGTQLVNLIFTMNLRSVVVYYVDVFNIQYSQHYQEANFSLIADEVIRLKIFSVKRADHFARILAERIFPLKSSKSESVG